jgi:anti-repressor protein
MTTAIQTFNFNNSNVRVHVDENNEPWWVAKDVCDVLKLTNNRIAVSVLDEDEKGCVSIADAIGRLRETTIINESGLYELIWKSRKPEAKAFKRWVKTVVLPSIRKHGGYIAGMENPEMSEDELIERAYILMYSRMQEQEKELEEARPKLEAYDQFLEPTHKNISYK